MILEICCHSVFLVVRDRVDVAKSPTRRERAFIRLANRINNCGFGLMGAMAWVDLGSADIGNIWTAVRPGGTEDGMVRSKAAIRTSVSGRTGNTVVARCVEDGNSLKAKLQKSQDLVSYSGRSFKFEPRTRCTVFVDSKVEDQTPGHRKKRI